jgi:hypothetical protein
MKRMRGKKIFVRREATRRPAPYELIERIRRHFVGRVMTLAAATAFAATLSLVLLPLATRHLELRDYGTYGLLMSIVALVGAATDGGASLLVPAHYGLASASERARLFSSLAVFTGIGASTAGLFLIILWAWQHGTFSGQAIPLAAIALSAVLMPMRAITNLSILIFSVTGRGPAIAAQMAVQSLVAFFSTLISLLEFRMGGDLAARWRSVRSGRRVVCRSPRPRTSPHVLPAFTRLAPARRCQGSHHGSVRLGRRRARLRSKCFARERNWSARDWNFDPCAPLLWIFDGA